MVSKHGLPLLPPDAVGAIRGLLMPRAALITPNVPEAEALTGMKILTVEDMRGAACRLRELGIVNVIRNLPQFPPARLLQLCDQRLEQRRICSWIPEGMSRRI